MSGEEHRVEGRERGHRCGVGKIGPRQIRPGQIRPGQIGPGQIGPGQIAPRQIAPRQIGFGQRLRVRPHQDHISPLATFHPPGRLGQHLCTQIHPDDPPVCTDRLLQQLEVQPGAAADVEHPVAGPQVERVDADLTAQSVDRLPGDQVVRIFRIFQLEVF